MHTVLRRTVITDGHDAPLMPSWGSISRTVGAQCDQPSCANIPSVALAMLLVCSCPQSWLTTCCRSRMVANASTGATSKRFVCRAITARLRERPQQPAGSPRGGQSLVLTSCDACAWSNFCACKMKSGGLYANSPQNVGIPRPAKISRRAKSYSSATNPRPALEGKVIYSMN